MMPTHPDFRKLAWFKSFMILAVEQIKKEGHNAVDSPWRLSI